jgi:hypothetical protein
MVSRILLNISWISAGWLIIYSFISAGFSLFRVKSTPYHVFQGFIRLAAYTLAREFAPHYTALNFIIRDKAAFALCLRINGKYFNDFPAVRAGFFRQCRRPFDTARTGAS